MAEVLSPIRRQILEYIATCQRERSFPPTIREIGDHVGLKSPATVANHISVLRSAGYLAKNPQQPRTLTVKMPAVPQVTAGVRELALVGDVAAGTGVLGEETDNETISLPEALVGRSDCFVLRVRGTSMVDAGILPGDLVVVARQKTAEIGEIVVAGIPDGESTIKRYFPQGSRVVLKPENAQLEPMEFAADDVVIYGRVVSVLRTYL